MKYVTNRFTGKDLFYHSSRDGIEGKITPFHNDPDKKRDFGDGFYLGDRKKQTIALVSSSANAEICEIKIPYELLNEKNTLFLSKVDWMYFVLFNRGRLENIRETELYDYYRHLADGKHFIVGTIADDVFSSCIKDFMNGTITDYMFLELIDCYSYGSQILAKSQYACDELDKNIFIRRRLTVEERKESINSRGMNRAEQERDYIRRRANLLRERKGLFIEELFDEIRKGNNPTKFLDGTKMDNIEFESPMKGGMDNGYFR